MKSYQGREAGSRSLRWPWGDLGYPSSHRLYWRSMVYSLNTSHDHTITTLALLWGSDHCVIPYRSLRQSWPCIKGHTSKVVVILLSLPFFTTELLACCLGISSLWTIRWKYPLSLDTYQSCWASRKCKVTLNIYTGNIYSNSWFWFF